MRKVKQEGITLIALVITIIVLLILAGVSIAMLTGENGILTQANNAKIEQSHGAVRDGIALAYNEYQIEINTASNEKIASTETVQIQGKEERALASYSSFLDFLLQKGYVTIDEENSSTGIINVEALTGSRQSLGNGTGSSDVYKIEEKGGNYEVNYYDINEVPQQIWSVEGKIELEADTGKEALILVYEVSAGDTIELPWYTGWSEEDDDDYTGDIWHDSVYNFNVDWGDGEVTQDVTNDNIDEKAVHTYTTGGEKEISITGQYDVLEFSYGTQGEDKLTKVKQWGTTGLKSINLRDTNLNEIARPTQGSFKELSVVSFSETDLREIPDKLFLNCENIKSFEFCFDFCYNLESVGDYVFANCVNAKSFVAAFRGCYNLTTLGEGVFEGCNLDTVQDFSNCFLNCESLEGSAPELWLTGTNSEENNYIGLPDGHACFYGCTSLENYDEIPAYWKDEPYG